jgi:8-oxo-dGTP pyrophosphatase MutT (NUDIX family)
MSLTNHALYQVATKALLFDDDKLLVLYTPEGYLDFPGGRVDESERDLPWTEALQREIAEEVGPEVRVDIGQTLFVSKRSYNNEGKSTILPPSFLSAITAAAIS